MNTPPSAHSSLARTMGSLLIAAAAAMAVGRVLSAQLVYEPSLSENWPNDPGHPKRKWPANPPRAMPTFSSNDRSRWAAVRALVDRGTWVIGRRDRESGKDSGIIFEDGWQSVDKMLNPETLEFYSTKPPLLTFLVAGEYWLLKKTFGWTLAQETPEGGDRRFAVVRVCLLTFNVLPFVIYLILLTRLAEHFGVTDWGCVFVVTAASFATLMTPFLLTLNNHTLAACSVVVAVYATVRIRSYPYAHWLWFVVAGFFAGFAFTNELPAAAFTAGLGLLLLFRFPKRTLLAFAPAALVPVAALGLLNWEVMGNPLDIGYSKFGTEWYEYEGSHWKPRPGSAQRGIDWAKNAEGKGRYAFNLLLGHHGWFSLTPLYLLGLAGMGLGAWRLRGSLAPPSRLWAELAVSTFLLSLVVIAYYIFKSNNYGGWTNGPRWLMWLSPLWLLTMLPIADWLGSRRWGRCLCLALLALSVMSAHYWDWNPWRHPWIYNWMDASGRIPY